MTTNKQFLAASMLSSCRALLRSSRFFAVALAIALAGFTTALTGCGGGTASTKVEMPENPTALPSEDSVIKIGPGDGGNSNRAVATPKGRAPIKPR